LKQGALAADAKLRKPFLGPAQQRPGDIRHDHLQGWSDPGKGALGQEALSRSHIEERLAGAQPGAVENAVPVSGDLAA
jgi:hypothetical protein